MIVWLPVLGEEGVVFVPGVSGVQGAAAALEPLRKLAIKPNNQS